MTEPPRKRLAVLISGRGSNMESILAASREDDYPAAIAVVISDNAMAAGLETAMEADIPAFGFERSEFNSRSEHEAAISKVIR